MKILTYNINGLNSAHKKGVLDTLFEKFYDVDIFCFQEVKAQEKDIEAIIKKYPDYLYLSNSNHIKKGYAGVLILIQRDKYNQIKGWSNIDLEPEPTDMEMLKYWGGRVAMIEFNNFCLYNIYTPNSKNKEELRKMFDSSLIETVKSMNKPTMIVGDLNVCPTKYDYWGKYEKVIDTMPGLMQFEIDGYNKICEELQLTNGYRQFYPEGRDYTFYPNSKGGKNLQGDKGWILDHCLVPPNINITSYRVYSGLFGEDHSPILIEI